MQNDTGNRAKVLKAQKTVRESTAKTRELQKLKEAQNSRKVTEHAEKEAAHSAVTILFLTDAPRFVIWFRFVFARFTHRIQADFARGR
jgi:hypothetical protein